MKQIDPIREQHPAIRLIKSPWFIMGLFAIIYLLQSLVNHLMFRSAAYDLGIFNNALYDYAHFRPNISMVRIGSGPGLYPKNLLSDHFELYPVLFSPFYYFFGSYTLLIFQVASVVIGGFGIYKLISLRTKDDFLARAAMLHFYVMWGIFTALAFDYHNNVVAAMAIPWFFYFFFDRKFIKAGLVFLFIAAGKENMPLLMCAIGAGLAIGNYRDKQFLKMGALFCVLGFISFALILKVIIPFFANPGDDYAYNTFHTFGNNMAEVMRNIILHPLLAVKMLFVNHLGIKDGDYVKVITHIVILLSGGWALIFRPQYLVMLIPVYFQKMFYDEPGRWGCYYQYSVEFAPILVIASFTVIYYYFKDKTRQKTIASIATIVATLCTTIYVLNSRHAWAYEGATLRFYSKKHYMEPFNLKDVKEAMNMIPDNASVSAHCEFVPRLAFRDTIYQFPYGKGSEYIFLIQKNTPYKITGTVMDSLRKEYSNSQKGKILFDKDSIILIRNYARRSGAF